MGNLQKAVSMLLCASVALSTCSCKSRFREEVLDKAASLGKYVAARDYKNIEKLADEGDRKLEVLLTLNPDSGSEDYKARSHVASTLTYDVIEDSYEGGVMGSDGSVEIAFSYADYSSVLSEKPVFWSVDDFSAAVDECEYRVVTTVRFFFAKEGDKVVCTNISDIESVFPYSVQTFDFADSISSYVGDFTFTDNDPSSFDLGFRDIDTINCSLEITGDGRYLTWQYYCVVKRDDEEVFTSDIITADCPESFDISYTSVDPETGFMEDGTYTFTFFTAEGIVIDSAFVDVTHTQLTPTPTPEGNYLGSQYITTDDQSIQLPHTDIILTIPDEMYFCDADSDEVQQVVDGGLGANLMVMATDDFPTGTIRLIVFDFKQNMAYDSPISVRSFNDWVDGLIDDLETAGIPYDEETMEIEVGDNVYTVRRYAAYYDEGTIYCTCVAVGDDNNTYMCTWVTNSQEQSDELLDSFSWAS